MHTTYYICRFRSLYRCWAVRRTDNHVAVGYYSRDVAEKVLRSLEDMAAAKVKGVPSGSIQA